jgi:REP element-mobilizing transposase RayT
VFKDISSRKILDDHSEIKDVLWGGDFWSEDTYVSSLESFSSEVIKGHIGNTQNVKIVDF